MTILVVGGGGREHAIIKKLRQSPKAEKIYALPGNGGISADAECVPIGAKDIDGIVAFATEKKVDFAVVAPDDPLVLGCVDRLEEAGIRCFGPTARAAQIEGSKAFSKELMRKYGIPTAEYEIFTDCESAKEYVIAANRYPTVIKADGLALGKGVIIAENEAQAIEAIDSIMTDRVFGESGNTIVIEEFLTGPEVSVLAFTDGETLVPMVSSMDHKRAHDGDTGLNTGGMGCIAPNPFYTPDVADYCMENIFLPTVRAMNAEGRTFKGCLYFGLMITPSGAKVIEYNCRFGDPETQAVLPLLKTDLLDIMEKVRDGKLKDIKTEFDGGCSACVIVASGGYPSSYEKGKLISFGDISPEVSLYHAGTKVSGDGLVTSGGRVIGVSATATTLEGALKKAYENVGKVRFDGAFYRRDIGKRALEAQKSSKKDN